MDQRRATIILVAMALSTFLFVTVESLPSGLLTLMAPDLGRSTSQIGLLVTGYALVVLVASVPLAHWTRRVPRRWVLSACAGLAAASTLWAALAPDYEQVLLARLLTGSAQALFWVAVVPATAGLFPPLVRGKVMARLAVGNSLAPVIGVPLGTWLGEHTSWRVTFLAVAGLSLVVTLVVLALFPTLPPTQGGASSAPLASRRRFGFDLVVTLLLVTGSFGIITFVTQYLIEVVGYTQSDIPRLLLAQGAAGVAGAVIVGRFLDRHPVGALLAALGVVSAAQLALGALGGQRVASVVALAVIGLAFSTVPPVLSHRVMLVAPGSTTMAMAVSSSAFNLGIAAGSALGAAVVTLVGVRAVPFASGALVLLALVVALLEERFNPPLGSVVQNDAEKVADASDGATSPRVERMGPVDDSVRCPCLSGNTYGDCCGPLHRGEREAPTAETVMRARYSAYAVGDEKYVLASWHPRTRPATLVLDPTLEWRRLDVLATREGGPFDDAGEVEFAAFCRDAVSGQVGRLHEVSRFVREDGTWLYVDGDIQP